MSKKKQLTSIDKMKLKLKQQTKEKQNSLFTDKLELRVVNNLSNLAVGLLA